MIIWTLVWVFDVILYIYIVSKNLKPSVPKLFTNWSSVQKFWHKTFHQRTAKKMWISWKDCKKRHKFLQWIVIHPLPTHTHANYTKRLQKKIHISSNDLKKGTEFPLKLQKKCEFRQWIVKKIPQISLNAHWKNA